MRLFFRNTWNAQRSQLIPPSKPKAGARPSPPAVKGGEPHWPATSLHAKGQPGIGKPVHMQMPAGVPNGWQAVQVVALFFPHRLPSRVVKCCLGTFLLTHSQPGSEILPRARLSMKLSGKASCVRLVIVEQRKGGPPIESFESWDFVRSACYMRNATSDADWDSSLLENITLSSSALASCNRSCIQPL